MPQGGRPNPYSYADEEFSRARHQGRLHAQIYPVEVSGLLPPLRPILNLFESEGDSLIQEILKFIFGNITGFQSLQDLLQWVGLHPYPKVGDKGVYSVPYPGGKRPNYQIGFGAVKTPNGVGFAISCAGCHSSNLFGKTVLGLTNRFPKANETFYWAQQLAPYIHSSVLRDELGATKGEVAMYLRAKRNLQSVGVKLPIVEGLDTSLAQVALSLAKRNSDPYATYSEYYQENPRKEPLAHYVADSKPAVWWNVKYKNRWLSDGSVISGNPIYTNILWNEIGRGADLKILAGWLKKNSHIIEELTTAVFSSEAPRITDFFPSKVVNLPRAQRGEKIFQNRCAGCHGSYEKAWSLPEFDQAPLVEKLKTVKVTYHERTPVIEVGTDPQRRIGMKSLEALNRLQISKENGILVKAQRGYVPPPLVGIWARWPYFHNNSAPSLCAVLTRSSSRPKKFYMGEANRQEDFDVACNGYPKKVPDSWKEDPKIFDTSVKGLSNAGHDEGIFLNKGKEILSNTEKYDLIQFLQTL